MLGVIAGFFVFRPAFGEHLFDSDDEPTTSHGTSSQNDEGRTPPVEVSVEQSTLSLDEAWIGSPATAGQAIATPPRGSDCDEVIAWAHRDVRMVDRGHSGVTVTITATRDVTMTVEKIRPIVLSRQKPRDDAPALVCVPFDPYADSPFEDGTSFRPISDLDGPNAEPGFVIDSTSADFRPGAEWDGEGLEMAAAEEWEISLAAFARTCDCTWSLELVLSLDGRAETLQVADATGRPFRTSAYPNRMLTSQRDRVWCRYERQMVFTSPDARRCPSPTLEDRPLY